MNPISPVLPSSPQMTEIVLAKDQPQYLPLPVVVDGSVTISRWRLTLRERLTLLWRGTIWLRQMNFGQPLQPQLIEVNEPRP